MDQIVADNSVKEDEYEGKVKDLQEEFKLADTRAEFAERSVDKVCCLLPLYTVYLKIHEA